MTKRTTFFTTLCFILCSAAAFNALPAQARNSVAAVVNDTVITTTDLDHRVDLLLTQIPDSIKESTSNIRQQLAGRAMTELLREELYRDFAKQQNITVLPPEIDTAFAMIEKNNNMENGALKTSSEQWVRSLRNRVVADLLWQKVIRQYIVPRVTISNSEIDQLIEGFAATSESNEYEIAQIFIQNKADATRVYNNLNDGADFARQAAMFGDDAIAGKGGYLGWFNEKELAPYLKDVFHSMDAGSFSAPIKQGDGFRIVKLIAKRKVKGIATKPVTEQQIAVLQRAIPQDKDDKKDAYRQFKKKAKSIDSFKDMEAQIKHMADDIAYAGSRSYDFIAPDALPSALQKIINNLDKNEHSDIKEINNAWVVVYKGAHREVLPEGLEALRERVRSRVQQSKVELLTRQLLRNLRRKAFVDVRL